MYFVVIINVKFTKAIHTCKTDGHLYLAEVSKSNTQCKIYMFRCLTKVQHVSEVFPRTLSIKLIMIRDTVLYMYMKINVMMHVELRTVFLVHV